jgi:hypothetical protein
VFGIIKLLQKLPHDFQECIRWTACPQCNTRKIVFDDVKPIQPDAMSNDWRINDGQRRFDDCDCRDPENRDRLAGPGLSANI